MIADPIARVEALTVSLPLDRPVWASGLRIALRDFLIVRIALASGRCGYGFHKSRGIALDRIVRDNLAPLLIGQDPWRVERLWRVMHDATLLAGRTGAVMRTIGTVDIALWDLRAQLAGVPLYRMLGGYRTECDALLVTGYYEEDPHDCEPMQRQLAAWRAGGCFFFKIAAGMLAPAADDRRLAAAREAIGPEAGLAADINGVWPEPKIALRAARLWERHDLRWIEDPFPIDRRAQLRELTRRSPVAVAVGDEQGSPGYFHELIAAQALDVLRLDTPVVGGITPALRILAVAEAAGVPVSPHLYPEINVHLAAAFRNVVAVETFGVQSDLYQIDKFITPGLDVNSGRIAPPDTPGLGLRLDWDGLAKHSI
jgi:L-alanine-DL-glutamate epimerase-like enolase superfamily enzyme